MFLRSFSIWAIRCQLETMRLSVSCVIVCKNHMTEWPEFGLQHFATILKQTRNLKNFIPNYIYDIYNILQMFSTRHTACIPAERCERKCSGCKTCEMYYKICRQWIVLTYYKIDFHLSVESQFKKWRKKKI